MNSTLKSKTVGHVYDGLQALAEQLTKDLPKMTDAEREVRWTRISAVLKARDTLDWASKQVAKWELERTL
jgi:hypothetical protein